MARHLAISAPFFPSNTRNWRSCVLALAIVAAVITTQSAQAQTFTTLANVSGGLSHSGLVQDLAGNLYGTTSFGGSEGFGTVFKVDTTGTVTVLHTFTAGADGAFPIGNLVLDAAGNLYGTTTISYSPPGSGTVFKLDPTGTLTVLYNFTGGADGGQPGGLVSDPAGNLYGTASSGGITVGPYCASGCGTVFKVAPSGIETTMYSFTGQAGDGAVPTGNLALDAAGNIYGTTCACGPPGKIFKVDPAGTETIVYSSPGYSGEPTGDLVLDAADNIYFPKTSGSRCTTVCGGSVNKLDSAGVATTLHGFAGSPDGRTPYRLVLGQSGNVFGTTFEGGTGSCTTGNPPVQVGCGTIFEIDGAGNETVLYSFTGQADGKSPTASLIVDAAGSLYGTTSSTVFKFSPPGPDFSLSATAFTPGSVSPGASSTSTVSVVALRGFGGAVAFTCSVAPMPKLAPTCSIQPGSTTPATPATLTVKTTAPGGALLSSRDSGFLYALWLPLIGLVAMSARLGSDQGSRRKILTTVVLACLLLAGLASQVACGGGAAGPPSPPVSGTPAGSYTITITGTYAAGSLTHSTTTMLAVQ